MLDEQKPPNGTTHTLRDAKPPRSRISHFQTLKSQVKLFALFANLQIFIVLLQNFMWMGLESPTSTLILGLAGQDFYQSAAT